MSTYVDFSKIDSILSLSKKEYLKNLYPDGYFEGHEFKPLGKDCTLSINHNSLAWCRFSEGRTGKGILSMFAYTHHNDNIREAGLELNKLLNITDASPQILQSKIVTHVKKDFSQQDDKERKRRFYYRLWQEATDVYNTPAMKYLHARGLLTETSKEMRFHPNIFIRTENKEKIYCGCLLSPITDINHHFMGIFRTFLNPDDPKNYLAIRNKSHPITQGKYKGLLGSPTGGAVKFGNAESPYIILTEGIEDALSAYQTVDPKDKSKGIFSIPQNYYSVWAFLGTSHLQKLQIPKGKKIILIIDNDDSGLKAEEKFRIRMKNEGYSYEAVIPKKYKDLNALHINKQEKRA
jgi:hypothetical protein